MQNQLSLPFKATDRAQADKVAKTLLAVLLSGAIYSSHLARVDIIAAAFGFISLAIHINNRGRNAWLDLLAGLSIAAAYENHPHSAIFGPALLSLFFFERGRSAIKDRGFWSSTAGILFDWKTAMSY